MSRAGALLAYEYAVLRCVPRADREEFCNVGVVLHCRDADYLAAAWTVDESRLTALAPGIDVARVRSALEFADAVCAGDTTGAGDAAQGPISTRFGFLKAPRSTVVRPGPVHGGLCADPAEALRHVFVRMVQVGVTLTGSPPAVPASRAQPDARPSTGSGTTRP